MRHSTDRPNFSNKHITWSTDTWFTYRNTLVHLHLTKSRIIFEGSVVISPFGLPSSSIDRSRISQFFAADTRIQRVAQIICFCDPVFVCRIKVHSSLLRSLKSSISTWHRFRRSIFPQCNCFTCGFSVKKYHASVPTGQLLKISGWNNNFVQTRRH